jgi:uncharacterized protein
MNFFKAWRHILTVTDINVDELKKEGIKLIIFDFDNTLTHHGSGTLKPGTVRFLDFLRSESFRIFVLSNAKKRRIDRILYGLGLEGRGLSFKPFPVVLNRVIKNCEVLKRETVLIGDQIFTDIAAGNLAGIKTILVERISDNESRSIKFRRKLEAALINRSRDN